EQITIDGSTGEIFPGTLAGSWQVTPEAGHLMGLAADLGIELPASGEPQAPEGTSAHVDGAFQDGSGWSDLAPLTEADLVLALLVKGAVGAEQLGEAVGARADDVGRGVKRAVDDGTIEATADAFRLTSGGKLRALDLVSQDRGELGDARCVELLEAFHAFDDRMKAIITAWQVRGVGDEQALNDHGDPAYDAGVLDDLYALDAETGTWLDPLAQAFRRYASYRLRLRRAAEAARAGDRRFVASPRVDSYHSVWFELHEDLIRLGGRRREDEASAGRA
ncbi:MAG: hypothetical protein M3406_18460, partial [Chloroflexota bacterium]|nr:hypothetical protein [Chloroflexota bacterium]